MTATGFLTDERPRLAVSYQILSMIPARHPILTDIDNHGEHDPAMDQVWVPENIWNEVQRIVDNDPPDPDPDIDPAPPTYEQAITEQDAFAAFRTTIQEQDRQHQNERRINEQWAIDIRGRLVTPTVERPSWFVIELAGQDQFVTLNPGLPEPEAMEDIVNQFHDIENQLASQLDEIMSWARETWREQNAVHNG